MSSNLGEEIEKTFDDILCSECFNPLEEVVLGMNICYKPCQNCLWSANADGYSEGYNFAYNIYKKEKHD